MAKTWKVKVGRYLRGCRKLVFFGEGTRSTWEEVARCYCSLSLSDSFSTSKIYRCGLGQDRDGCVGFYDFACGWFSKREIGKTSVLASEVGQLVWLALLKRNTRHQPYENCSRSSWNLSYSESGNQGRNNLYLQRVFASGVAEPKSLTLTASEARATVILENLVMPKLRTSEEALTFVILLRTEESHHEGSLSNKTTWNASTRLFAVQLIPAEYF